MTFKKYYESIEPDENDEQEDDDFDETEFVSDNFDKEVEEGLPEELESEEDAEYVDEDDVEFEQLQESVLNEMIERKWVLRQGRRVLKFKTNREGYKVKMENGRPREVRISIREQQKRKVAQDRAKRIRATSSADMTKKRLNTMGKK